MLKITQNQGKLTCYCQKQPRIHGFLTMKKVAFLETLKCNAPSLKSCVIPQIKLAYSIYEEEILAFFEISVIHLAITRLRSKKL